MCVCGPLKRLYQHLACWVWAQPGGLHHFSFVFVCWLGCKHVDAEAPYAVQAARLGRCVLVVRKLGGCGLAARHNI